VSLDHNHDRVLASFYYGNLTYPSTDPPKIGFLSTVPPDADQKLKDASNAASAAGNVFPGEFRPSLHSRHLFLVLVSFLSPSFEFADMNQCHPNLHHPERLPRRLR
jgi:hypothetical protein